jgi:hypothetical protein
MRDHRSRPGSLAGRALSGWSWHEMIHGNPNAVKRTSGATTAAASDGAVPAPAQNMIFARKRPVTTATAVATMPGIMNEWLSTYLPIFVVPDRSKLIAAISEP